MLVLLRVVVAVRVGVVFFRRCFVSFAFDVCVETLFRGNEVEENRTQITHKFNKENIILKRFGKSTREREKEREQYCDLY